MNKFKETLKNLFATIKNFISIHKKETLIILSLSVFIIILIIISLTAFKAKNETSQPTKKTEITIINNNKLKNKNLIDINALWLLDEPLNLPPIQFSREQRQIWDKKEIDYWYTAPNKEAMNELHKKNKEIINKILEKAP